MSRPAGRALAVAAVLAVLGAAPAAAAPLAISPAPGTPDASPATQISVLGIAPGRIAAVRAAGARTGVHAGRLRPYSGARGASFVPARPFAVGERVAVVVRLRGRRALRTRFTVARPGATPPVLTITATQPDKLEHFVTAPGLRAPLVTLLRGGSAAADPIFLTPLPSPIIHPESDNTVTIEPVGPGGPMIVDGLGRLVWFRQLTPPAVAANLAVARYRGRRVLTWWQGPVTAQAFGLGKGIIADSAYRTVAEVQAGNGYRMDIHEFALAPGGDAIFTVYSPVLMHLPGTPAGTRSPVLDAIVQEVDIRTGLVVWEWHALGHIPLADSYATPANSASYDAFHINSIQPLGRGRLLISARDTSAVYEVDRATGRILWTLGGRASTFRMGPGARFWLQHDVLALPGGRISMFDDQAGPPRKGASRGLVLRLDHRRRTAVVERSVTRAQDTSAQSEGSARLLPGGGLFVGFGAAGPFSEFSRSGRLLFDARLPEGDGSYRTLRFPWRGRPLTRPAVVVRRTDPAHVTVSVSWNGATGVARWQVLAGAGSAPVASAPSAGFETTIDVAAPAGPLVVRALDARGRVLAASAPAAPREAAG
ncbi:ArsR family transcriptional regulator [Baekduia soli]|uniref:ArsR family transcriptional regulator n=1 Tax=Baekduia soli TaxID=496014 RepID=A0A5B8U5K5_9ACTN|nr:arylsulfotransferase family protein [Baekduia soli]QEC48374.1 ArsR family transcriptional regulator [Baekduia soli]